MARKILVPLDGSALSRRALGFALALLHDPQDELVLLRSVSAAQTSEEGAEEPVHEAERYLAETVAELKSRGFEAEPHVYVDDAAKAILAAIDTLAVTLVVMSTHGRGGIGRWIYGSVADAVLRHAGVPILLVPASCERPWSAGQPSRFLVPLDGSRVAEEGLGVAAQLARETKATIVLLRVIEPPAPIFYPGDAMAYVGPDPEEIAAEAGPYLKELAHRLQESGIAAETVIRGGYAASSIVAAAGEQDTHLTVMATHGRGGLARLVLGSVATGVLQQGTTPLLVVRPRVLVEP